jgi:hypothetical protein
MADLGSLDLKSLGGEARVRALLEDLIQYYVGLYPQHPLALAVWFNKAPEQEDQNLLILFAGNQGQGINVVPRSSLLWKRGGEGAPYLQLRSSSVGQFTELVSTNSQALEPFQNRSEVLYFDPDLLTDEIKRYFNVITAPSGLVRGWYVPRDLYERSLRGEYSLRSLSQAKPEMGIIKTDESPDFVYAKGLLHVQVNRRWLPLSLAGLKIYSWYNDWESKQPGFFLLEGGALYEILKFEIKAAPEYPNRFRLLDKLPDDRYTEVYLRAVPATGRAAA